MFSLKIKDTRQNPFYQIRNVMAVYAMTVAHSVALDILVEKYVWVYNEGILVFFVSFAE